MTKAYQRNNFTLQLFWQSELPWTYESILLNTRIETKWGKKRLNMLIFYSCTHKDAWIQYKMVNRYLPEDSPPCKFVMIANCLVSTKTKQHFFFLRWRAKLPGNKQVEGNMWIRMFLHEHLWIQLLPALTILPFPISVSLFLKQTNPHALIGQELLYRQ